ncbi:MAG: hypothetical protein OJF49_000357 [Ktedonobacterales bacterium]|nr:MAG: hypothetical protein OJF49_000357 [Ktedonobacterales bacterium]
MDASGTYVGNSGDEATRSPVEARPDSTTPPVGARVSWWPVLKARVNRLLDRYPYPELPPARQGIAARIALAVVALLAVAFFLFFAFYMFAKHDAYLTYGEDMGIMDQALWNLAHGYGMHQTICNPIGDTNCLGDVSRLAIHFEPIMFVFGLLYAIIPSPKLLLCLQALIVASGAFPAFWLASRWLRSLVAGVAFAALFLLYPALQAAVTYDFHAVTLSAAFLMFALYFMMSRNNVGLVIACVLALSTKENIPADVLLIGLSILFFQRRWRIGLGLCVLALLWLAIELPIMRALSPLGASPTASRYAYLGHSPVQAGIYLLTHPLQVVKDHVLDAGGVYYLRTLLSPVAYLPLLSPFALVIAAPAIAINILSTNPSMRSGLYHYNAEIVPMLIFASIASVWMLAGVARWLAARATPVLNRATLAIPGSRFASPVRVPAPAVRVFPSYARRVAVYALVGLMLLFSLHEQQGHGYLPITHDFTWPQTTAHTRIADEMLPLIPANASVSAQAALIPHISQRRYIYQFPYKANNVDYVFLDITGETYPFVSADQYFATVRALLLSQEYHVVAARDGYLLLARGRGPTLNPNDPYGLPETFYSFSDLTATTLPSHTVIARFGSNLELTGYDISPTTPPDVNTFVTITTYWRISAPLSGQYAPQLILTRSDGSQLGIVDFPALALRPMSYWQPSTVYALRARMYVTSREQGLEPVGVSVAAGPVGQDLKPLPVTLESVPGVQGRAPWVTPDHAQVVFLDLRVG